jgi:tetratricopeptide (TPR) repeat protein
VNLPNYAAESVVIERTEFIYTYAADGTCTLDRVVAVRVQSDAAVKALGVISVAYAANSQKVEFAYVRVRHPDGSVAETPVTDTIDMPAPVTREAPFYSDLKEKQLPVRSMRVGDRLEWKARITTTKSEAPGQFWGQETMVEDAVTLAEVVELRVPASVAVNVWSPANKPDESTADGMHVWRWNASQLKPTAGKEAGAAAEAKKKLVWTAADEVDADQGKLPSIAWTTFKSWQQVGEWYASLEADRLTPGPDVTAKVAELTAGKTTDEDKVRALYAYVATQIRYIGVAFGIGRYQPHSAAEILSNQYGDCKDKHTLLAAMLAVAGIKSDAVLIGAGVRFNEAVPSPAAFNHLITHATVAGQEVWLDTTAEIAPYRMLVSVTRDKQALVVPGAGAAYVARTPADPPFASFQTMDATGEVDKNGIVHARLSLVVRGDTELLVRSAFRQTSPGQYNQVVQQISYGIGYGGTTSNVDVMRPEDVADPFKFSYDYLREKTPDWDESKMIPEVLPAGLPRFGDSDPLVRDLDLGWPQVETSHAAMKIPEGWTAILPEAAHYKCAYATYDQTYRFEKGTVYTERRVEVLKRKVPSGDLKAFKKFADDANLGNDPFIYLLPGKEGTAINIDVSKADAGGDGAATEAKVDVPAASTGADLTKLLHEAAAYAQQGDLDRATGSLDRAKGQNPELSGLWGMYGAVAMERGKLFEAIGDYQKELKLHPEEYYTYPALVEAEMRLADRKAAMETLHAWATAEATNPEPSTRLMTMQLEDGDAKGVIVTAEAALKHLPNDPKKTAAIEFALARAELQTGEMAKGTATIHAVLKYADEPADLNVGAHALADAALDLPLAETSVRTAIAKLTEESNTWTGDENPAMLKKQSELLLDAWGTLGWVLLREHKLEQAGTFLNAAWLGGFNAETAEHLGDLAMARQDKRAAMAAYELGLAQAPTYDGMGVRRPPGPLESKLQKDVDALLKAGVKSTVGTADDPYKKVAALRMIPLGTFDGVKGTANFRVLLREGKVVHVEELHNDGIKGGVDMVEKAKLPALWPAESHATLARYGTAFCYGMVCQLALQP